MIETDLHVLSPQACPTMEVLRAEIDRIDQALVKLLACRQGYIERAAELKDHPDKVRDEARIADVLAKVVRASAPAGLSESIAEAVFRTLIEASIAWEAERFAALRTGK